MSIILDDAVFNIQSQGGISSFWSAYISFLKKKKIPFSIKKCSYGKGHFSTLSSMFFRIFGTYVGLKRDTVFHTSNYIRPILFRGVYVVSVYDFIYENSRQSKRAWLSKMLKYLSLKSADILICISHDTKEDLLKLYPNLSKKNIHVIHLGYDNHIFFKNYNGPFCYSALFVGVRRPHKRLDLAISSVSQVDNLFLTLTGPEVTASEYRLLESLLPNRWSHVNCKTSSDLAKLYNRSACLLYPSDFEGFGLPIIEASACGLPVICSNIAVFKEFYNGASLFATEQEVSSYVDCLKEVVSYSKDDREVLSTKLVKDCKYRTWENVLQYYVQCYKK
jgi:mannosyltransferase